MLNYWYEGRWYGEFSKYKRRHKIKTKASPYFDNRFLKAWEKQKNRRLVPFMKEDSFIPKEFYTYKKNTPFLSNKELKEKYLNKTNLSSAEESDLNSFLEKRRHLMDQKSKYHFTRAYYEFINDLQFDRLQAKDPKLAEIWSFWGRKVNFWKNSGSSSWENWKERIGYFSQKDMLSMADYEAIYTDMVDNIKHEAKKTNNKDRVWGIKAERVLPMESDKELFYYKLDQVPLRAYILKLKRTARNKKILAKEPMWQYHNPYTKRVRYIFPVNEFIHEHKRHKHLYFVKFQREAPLILEEVIKFKKVKLHEKRVHDSWKYILDKRISLRSKVKKFLQGDLWLQSRINFQEFFGFSWGEEYEKHKKGKSEVYEQAAWAGRFNFYGEWSKDSENPWLSRFHKLHYLDQWHWGMPQWYGNSFFLKEYFKPWLRFLQKKKISPYGTIENPDIFWFKYSHKELFYFRRADRTSIDPRKFESGAQFRKMHKAVSRLWYKAYDNEPERTVNRFFRTNKNTNLRHMHLPNEFLPESSYVKYYLYNGPNFWWNYKQFKIAKSVYFGPWNLSTAIKYQTFHEEFYLREVWYLLYNLWLPGLSKNFLIYVNPYICFLIYIIFLIFFCIFFFFGVKAPVRKVRWSFQWKEPIDNWRKVRATGKMINQQEEFRPILGAIFRHDFNWWFCLQVIPIIVFSVILPYFFIRLKLFYWFQYTTWLIYLGSASLVYMLKIYFCYIIDKFDNWMHKTISAEEYRKIWAEERALTHAAEKRYLGLLARKQKLKGRKYNPDHLDYKID